MTESFMKKSLTVASPQSQLHNWCWNVLAGPCFGTWIFFSALGTRTDSKIYIVVKNEASGIGLDPLRWPCHERRDGSYLEPKPAIPCNPKSSNLSLITLVSININFAAVYLDQAFFPVEVFFEFSL